MNDDFTAAAQPPLSEAEAALRKWGVNYIPQADGTLLVPGNIDIAWKGYTSLPDLSNVVVEGNFHCQNNSLRSLKGVPQIVKGDLNCANNMITSLEYAPRNPGGFCCDNNRLTTLAGGPVSVGSGGYFCSKNRLTSLEGAPEKVGGGFYCHNNPLTSFEGAPKEFGNLHIGLDTYSSWAEVPEELRTSPETKVRLAQEAEIARQKALDEAIVQATILQTSVRIGAPMKFKPRLCV